MTESLELPPVLDMVAASCLLEQLIGARGQDLALNAAPVQRLGAQCLQVLLAAANAWEADGHALAVENPSDDFIAALELMGVPPGNFPNTGREFAV